MQWDRGKDMQLRLVMEFEDDDLTLVSRMIKENTKMNNASWGLRDVVVCWSRIVKGSFKRQFR